MCVQFRSIPVSDSFDSTAMLFHHIFWRIQPKYENSSHKLPCCVRTTMPHDHVRCFNHILTCSVRELIQWTISPYLFILLLLRRSPNFLPQSCTIIDIYIECSSFNEGSISSLCVIFLDKYQCSLSSHLIYITILCLLWILCPKSK